jgi:two-component system, chemotaxis family, sensor kinase CheA
MKKNETRLVKLLKRLYTELEQVQSESRIAGNAPLLLLSEIIPLLPEKTHPLHSILNTVDESLNASNSQAEPLDQPFLTKLIQGVRVAQQSFSIDDDDIREKLLVSMVNDLKEILQQQVKSMQAANMPMVTLDDAAMLLIQTNPQNDSDLHRLKELFVKLATDPGNPVNIQSLGIEAAQMIERAGKETPAERASSLEEIGHLIEALSMDDSLPGPPPAPQTETKMTQLPGPISRPAEVPRETVLPETPDTEMLPADADTTLMADFVTESRDLIQGAEVALLSLETNPDDLESVNTVFRAFHTIKGTSAFLGLRWMTELAHHAESLLSRMRDKEIPCSGGYADLALRSSDMLKDLLQSVQNALGGEPMIRPVEFSHLMELLIAPEKHGISATPDEIPFKPRLGDILLTEGLVDRDQVDAALADKGPNPLGVALVRSQAATVTDVAKALRTQKRIETGDRAADFTVRVRTDRLDKLIDMVGELVIAQSMLAQDETVVHGGHVELLKKVTHSTKLVRELQDLSMSMRMVPLKATFQKMARLVRDLAHKSGKSVNFVTEGEDTEIDRNMVDVLNDPLVHIIRNSVDHGIEMPEARAAAGKAKNGIVRLAAFHAGGNVVVELQDDGRGLDRSKILKKAIERGLVEPDRSLTESEVMNLIFAPGFSTADKVTDVSGRGVGMDVVKRNIEKLHGKIEVNSTPGQGCLLSIRVPLTLAITDGMLVKVGTERYLLPTANIYISFRPEASALFTIAGRGEMVMLRGDLMPVVRLHRLFGVQGAAEDPQEALLVVIGEGEDRCALLVDELLGQHQVVAKSLGVGIGKIPGVAGGAIMGTGRVGLILDPVELTSLARQDY